MRSLFGASGCGTLCGVSSAESMRRHRANPENRRKGQMIVAARNAALAELAHLHPEDYERLCNKHRARIGLPPLRSQRGRPPLAALARLAPRLIGVPGMMPPEAAVG